MSEEKKVSGLGRELLPEELEQVNGGALSDEEIEAYLEQYDDPNLRRAWEVAIGILINYRAGIMTVTRASRTPWRPI